MSESARTIAWTCECCEFPNVGCNSCEMCGETRALPKRAQMDDPITIHKSSIRDSLHSSTRDSLHSSTRDSLHSSIRDSLHSSTRDSLHSSTKDSLHSSIAKPKETSPKAIIDTDTAKSASVDLPPRSGEIASVTPKKENPPPGEPVLETKTFNPPPAAQGSDGDHICCRDDSGFECLICMQPMIFKFAHKFADRFRAAFKQYPANAHVYISDRAVARIFAMMNGLSANDMPEPYLMSHKSAPYTTHYRSTDDDGMGVKIVVYEEWGQFTMTTPSAKNMSAIFDSAIAQNRPIVLQMSLRSEKHAVRMRAEGPFDNLSLLAIHPGGEVFWILHNFTGPTEPFSLEALEMWIAGIKNTAGTRSLQLIPYSDWGWKCKQLSEDFFWFSKHRMWISMAQLIFCALIIDFGMRPDQIVRFLNAQSRKELDCLLGIAKNFIYAALYEIEGTITFNEN